MDYIQLCPTNDNGYTTCTLESHPDRPFCYYRSKLTDRIIRVSTIDQKYTSADVYGGSCKACQHKTPEWYKIERDTPRPGDYIEVCVYCGVKCQIYGNPKSCQERRVENSKNRPTKLRWCNQCGEKQQMTTDGPCGPDSLNWYIDECIKCGQRHDDFRRPGYPEG